MKKKTLLIIGAGPSQAAGIVCARKYGCRVVAMDGNPEAPGLRVADVSIVKDVKDAEAAIDAAKKYKVDGVLGVASDICLPTVARVNQALGYPGLTLEQADLVTNKWAMRQRYAENGVPSSRFFLIHEESQLPEAMKTIGFPSVIKPVDNAGSRGVNYVDSEEKVRAVYAEVRAFSSIGHVILEQYMPGKEVSVEAFVARGRIHILTLSDKDRTNPPYLLDTAVIFPSAYPDDLQEKIRDVAVRAIRSLQIDNCPIHMELMVTPDGPKVVELAARGPGFKVFTDLIPFVTGVSGVDAQIRLLLGMNPDLEPRYPLKGACILFFAGKEGIVKEIRGLDTLSRFPGIHEIEIYVKPGDRTNALTCGADRLGHLIVLGEDRESCTRVARAAFGQVSFVY
ncbi:MAG: ATP-grasp domain-containing protein [Syntrophales bacterium]